MASPLGTLSKLPPELRIQIYNLALDTPNPNRFGFPITEIQIDPISYENTRHMELGPALFRTSRTIASETIPLYSRSHKFTIRLAPDPRGLLLGWLEHVIGYESWHYLRDVFLWSPIEYALRPPNMKQSQYLEVLFWSHREIMLVYRADRAQRLRFEVFSRPLNPPLARLLREQLFVREDWAEDVQKILDWIWVDAMRLGRRFMVERTHDLLGDRRFRAWMRNLYRVIKKGEILELMQKDVEG
ncbi:hypothetical protein MBLNU457_3718t1 [Dothideomycetes sp. NU457]